MKKIFIMEYAEESNSFNPLSAGFEFFNGYGIKEDEDIVNGKGFPTVCCGVNTLREAGYSLVGGVAMRSGSGGPVDSKTVDYFLEKITLKLKENKDIDGVLIVMHGATTSDKSQDVCGDIIEHVRNIVGENVIISATFDLHGNITQKILKNTDYISGYQAYPHVDLDITGSRGGQKLIKHFNEGRRYVACAQVPVIAPAHAYTTFYGKLNELMTKAENYKKSGEIDDYSIFQVQPWLDVSEMNASIVITSSSQEKSIKIANELALDEFNIREVLQGTPLCNVDFVIEQALKNKTGKPVVLVNSADSPNAGATGDSAYVIEKLLPYKDSLKCALSVTDKVAVDKAYEVGVGGVADFTLGASIAPKLSKPVVVKDAKVVSLHEGKFFMFGPQERGSIRNIGKTAVIQVGKLFIHLAYHGLAIGDKNFYASFGIDPELCDLVDVKACTSFRAGYEKFSAEIWNTNTPGSACPVLQDLPYEFRPKPLYPFEEISKEDIKLARVFRK